ncbi:MAG: PAS domain-containing sensor histidine kinase [Campylobacterota bacterium]|nr:PAS domain-containing sensor histidine kinase [Campylobacterota bacterium]
MIIRLYKKNKNLTKFFNSSIEAILVFKNEKLIEANQQTLDTYGYNSMNEILGKTVHDFVDEQQHSYLDTQLKKNAKSYQIKMKKADNTSFDALIHSTQIHKDTYVNSILDISENKLIKNILDELNFTLENEVNKNKQQQRLMLHQNRLAQMGEMISMIAHQWRQPLNNLSLLNQTIILKFKRNKLDDKLMEKFSTNSSKQIKQMSVTIDDFRNFFKPEKEKTLFYINDTVNQVLSIMNPIFLNNAITVNFNENSRASITGYPNELGQALLNILTNAKDALIDNNIENKIININLDQENYKVVLTIRDNAKGIPHAVKSNMFDPYYSTKKEKNGTGLGLYMTKIIIEDHMNGSIQVQNIQFKYNDVSYIGAEFRIIL